MAKLAVTYYENRGVKDGPYGFVYFNDDTRVGYPVMKEEVAFPDTFDTNWGNVDRTHHILAQQYLREQGVKGFAPLSEEEQQNLEQLARDLKAIWGVTVHIGPGESVWLTARAARKLLEAAQVSSEAN